MEAIDRQVAAMAQVTKVREDAAAQLRAISNALPDPCTAEEQTRHDERRAECSTSADRLVAQILKASKKKAAPRGDSEMEKDNKQRSQRFNLINDAVLSKGNSPANYHLIARLPFS